MSSAVQAPADTAIRASKPATPARPVSRATCFRDLSCLSTFLFLVLDELEQVSRLAIKKLADPTQRAEADALDVPRLQQADVLFGNAHVFRQVLGPFLASCQHGIEVDDDCHGLDELLVLGSEPVAFPHDPCDGYKDAGEKQYRDFVAANG